ncbi:hypothetical protein CO655_07925 [Rhizobium sp. M1]|nr:hypothetical protein CO655_07925 [Rhizobium sp. M1]
MGGEAVRVVPGYKTPPQPLPTRGRGYDSAPLRSDLIAIANIRDGNEDGATRGPSPLRGGLGGVFSFSSTSLREDLP